MIWPATNFTDDWTYVYFKRTIPYPGWLKEGIYFPVVEMISPHREEIVRGITQIIGISYTENPNLTIQKVEVRVGQWGEWVRANGTTNWSYIWDTDKEREGLKRIFIRAYDGGSYSEYYVLPIYVRSYGRGGLIDPLESLFRLLTSKITFVVLISAGILCVIIAIVVYLRKKTIPPKQ